MGLCLLLVYALATPRGSAPVVAVTSADGSEGLTLTLGLLEARRKKLGHLCCRLPVCLFVCCVVEVRRSGRRVSVTGLNRIQRHTSTGDTECYREQAQKPMGGSALMLARRGSVAGETVKSVRTHASPMSVRTYAG